MEKRVKTTDTEWIVTTSGGKIRKKVLLQNSGAKDKLMRDNYVDILHQRRIISRNVDYLRDMQTQFDNKYISAGYKLSIVCKGIVHLSQKCLCLQQRVEMDNCVICNIPHSVLTSIDAPDDVVDCGGVYVVVSYKNELIQLCNKNGERVNLFWCSIAAVAWFCSYLLTDSEILESDGKHGTCVRIPLGRGVILKYSWVEQTIVLIDKHARIYWHEKCDFEKFYYVCRDFPSGVRDVIGIVNKTFTPCLFVTSEGCVDCQY